jgi:hypothetical protein
LNTRWIIQKTAEEIYVRTEDLMNLICKLDCVGINQDVFLRWFIKCMLPFPQLYSINKFEAG